MGVPLWTGPTLLEMPGEPTYRELPRASADYGAKQISQQLSVPKANMGFETGDQDGHIGPESECDEPKSRMPYMNPA
jgi:hypothetical protein